jgi:hypothetical protein
MRWRPLRDLETSKDALLCFLGDEETVKRFLLQFLEEDLIGDPENEPLDREEWTRVLVGGCGATVDEVVGTTGWDRDEVASLASACGVEVVA